MPPGAYTAHPMFARLLRLAVVAVMVTSIAGAALLLARRWIPAGGAPAALAPADSGSSITRLGGPLPSLATAEGWLNGGAPPPDSLRGRPVLVVLWSSTRPAGLAAAARARAWDEAFGGYGLRVIGVHLPEFAFATDSAAVAAVVRRLGLRFPIALDPALRLAQAFGVHGFEPRLVLANGGGGIVAHADGDGGALEGRVGAELRRARPDLRFPDDRARLAASGAAPAAAWPPTLYVGATRVARGPLAGASTGASRMFTAQFRYQVEGRPYTPYPHGLWRPGADGVTAERGGAEHYLALRYDAGPLGAVLGPPATGAVRLWILRDEAWLPADQLGADVQVDGQGASYVLVDEPRLYQLCRAVTGEHVVKLSPEEPGVTIYAFTFEPAEPAAR
jgi:thioredoxin family protein